jgi:hypothetical protein
LILGNPNQPTMMVCVPNRLMIFLFQTVFSATEAAKLFTSHRASVLQQSSARGDRTERDAAPVPQGFLGF